MPPFFASLDGSTQKWKRNITQKKPLHKAGLKMRTYKTLSHTKRLQIECLLKAKLPVRKIAENIGVHISTIYRELKRGEYMHRVKVCEYIGYHYKEVKAYSPDIAQEKYDINKTAHGGRLKIGKNKEFAEYVEHRILVDGISPFAVAGELKRNNKFGITVCAATMYSYIRKGVFLNVSMSDISQPKKRRQHLKRAKRAPRGKSIEQRPKDIAARTEFGHWEMDCVCGPTKPCLLVLTERKTRKEIIYHMPDQTAASVVRCVNRLEYRFGKKFRRLFKTITVDNGSEFADVDGLQRSIYGGQRTTMYYCHPYRSNERGTNERINREIRRKLPKGTNFHKYGQSDIDVVERWVNSYPRKVLGFATSQEMFDEEFALLC